MPDNRDGLPATKRAARKWIRAHWADLISHADMGGVGDLGNDALDAVWSDECARIARRLMADAQRLGAA
jgi:hypothetical protein